MKKLSGKEYQELQNALLSAFPSQTTLEQMVKFCLNKDLAEIANGDNLGETIFKLIQWTETHGLLKKLVVRAHQRNSQNPDLSEFYNKYRQQTNQKPFSFLKRQSANRGKEKKSREKYADRITSRDALPQEKTKYATFDLEKLHGITENPYITESAWLDNFGFERSPFERLEAGSEEYAEPGFLSNCFVDLDGFLDILGQANAPITQILYAKRGEGKTACRVMTDYLCQHGSVPDKKTGQRVYVLSVPHIHFHSIANNPDLEHQVTEIMGRAVSQFADMLIDAEKIKNNFSQIPHAVLVDINWYIDFYSLHLNMQQLELLSHLGFKIPLDSASYPSLKSRNAISSLDHLKQWCRLMNAIGIKAVYVLVDGLDELTSTAADVKEAYRLLSPLLTNRELLDKTPHFALKCFLPTELENLILSDKAGRPELIPTQTIEWTNKKLKLLLRQRIQYFRRKEYPQTESGFEEFCTPELYGSIEDDLIEIAEFNPRSLLKLCDLMVESRCRANYPAKSNVYYLTFSDYRSAKEKFLLWKNKRPGKDVQEMFAELDIRKIINTGETDIIEFKSSLIRDLSNNQLNDALLMKVGKEIAGMLNSNGGVLLIGVGDDKSILGIEGDFEFTKKKNIDGFGLKLVDLIKENIGSQFFDFIKIDYKTLDEKTICAINVNASPKPVYFGKMEEFYIRSGTANLKLNTGEIVDYAKSHWE